MTNKQPHARKKGPGRYHVDGHKTPKPKFKGKTRKTSLWHVKR
jgi:hypothetical protein